MVQILRGHHLFTRQGGRVVLNPHISFFEDHVAFSGNVRLGQPEINHPISFHLHHQRQAVRRNPLIICGIIITRERVVRPTIRRDDLRQFTRRHVFGRLKQQVF